MAEGNLPDLDTSQIGFIAFWNALDHGVDSINVTKVLNSSNIVSYEQYDNGVEGTYSIDCGNNTRDNVKFRVKDDGWFITWIDRTNVFGQNGNYGDNYIDIMNEWERYTSHSMGLSPDQHNLERAINDLYGQLSNSGSITYNSTDIGLYNYEYESATTITQMHCHDLDSVSDYANISYTSGITRYFHAVGGGGDHIELVFAGYDVGAIDIGIIDVLANSLMPDAGVNYDHNINGGGVYHLMIWS